MTLELADWMKMSARVRADLDRADFTSRQRRVMQFVFWTTLMRRRLSVRVPRLRVLEPVLGMDKSHLSLNLRQLAAMRLLQIVKLDEGGMEIVILPDSTNWDVPWLYDRARFMGLVRDLDACTNQVQGQLLPPDPSLLAALADISAEQAYRGGVAESATGVAESATGVTESATPHPSGGGVGGAFKSRTEKGTSIRLKALSGLKALSSGEVSFEKLKTSLLTIETQPEPAALNAMKNILGADVMELSVNPETYRTGDGGKWRLRFRSNRSKVHRVFASLVEELLEGKVKQRGARAELLWQEFT
jgi:hypothetical protein